MQSSGPSSLETSKSRRLSLALTGTVPSLEEIRALESIDSDLQIPWWTNRLLRDRRYSDYVLVPHARYLFDYAEAPTDLACTYACAGVTAYSALKKTGELGPDDYLLAVGAGGVGLSGVHIAPLVTDAKLIVADIDPAKREAAIQAGVHAVIDNAAPDAVKQILAMTGGGVAASLDFVGMPAASRFAIDCLAKGGCHVIVGLYGDAISIPMPLFPFKSMTVRGSFVGSLAEMGELMALVRAGKIPPLPIETRPLDQATAALQDLRRGAVTGRVVLKP